IVDEAADNDLIEDDDRELIHSVFDFTDQIVRAIEEAARTGAIGDGKIWVTDVLQVIRVRTGEKGPEAVQ
ncbi:P-II family nitrogen regulator, partial [Bacillus sp. SIMBA_008]|uniref:P-II family nitrogen regulator n=1 Tax=Bacillus sp. SIMBA_008 TaxID=3085757 RepID=UPI00397AD9B5